MLDKDFNTELLIARRRKRWKAKEEELRAESRNGKCTDQEDSAGLSLQVGWLDAWMLAWVGGWLVAWMLGFCLVGWLGWWVFGWMLGWIGRWLVGWIDRWLVGWVVAGMLLLGWLLV